MSEDFNAECLQAQVSLNRIRVYFHECVTNLSVITFIFINNLYLSETRHSYYYLRLTVISLNIVNNVVWYIKTPHLRNVDELEVLKSIYGDSWKADEDSRSSHAIEITEKDKRVSLYISLPSNYPLQEPPIYTLSAPNLSTAQKNRLSSLLDEEYLANIGNSVLYQWVECIREFLVTITSQTDEEDGNEAVEELAIEYGSLEVPPIVHGEIITDRKSVFQPHLARVHSKQQVEQVLDTLKENRKIANATHNMYAYRICLGGSSYCQDCDDDGESQAGGRMLHLLQILNVDDVLVVVTRWYGGVHLGPDRFRHINNATRAVLVQAGLVKQS